VYISRRRDSLELRIFVKNLHRHVMLEMIEIQNPVSIIMIMPFRTQDNRITHIYTELPFFALGLFQNIYGNKVREYGTFDVVVVVCKTPKLKVAKRLMTTFKGAFIYLFRSLENVAIHGWKSITHNTHKRNVSTKF
jgi:hypothetical protein